MIRIFVGNESFLLRTRLQKALAERNGVEEYDSLSPDVFLAARQLSLFGEKRTIVVRAEELGASEELLAYLKNPSTAADLFIVAKKLDKRTALYRYLKEREELVWCEKLSEADFGRFVFSFIKRNGMRITSSAYQLFMERSDYFSSDDVTLDTIELYLKQMKFHSVDITEEEVMMVVPESTNQKIFDLTRLLLEKEVGKLFTYAHKLLENGENAIGMMSLLLRQMRLGYKACLLKDRSVAVISKELGVPSFQFEKMLGFEAKVMEEAISILQNGINGIKSGQAAARVMFLTTLAQLVLLVGIR